MKGKHVFVAFFFLLLVPWQAAGQTDPFEEAFFYKIRLTGGKVFFQDIELHSQLRTQFQQIDYQLQHIPAEEFIALLENGALQMNKNTGYGQEYFAIAGRAQMNEDPMRVTAAQASSHSAQSRFKSFVSAAPGPDQPRELLNNKTVTTRIQTTTAAIPVRQRGDGWNVFEQVQGKQQ